MSTDKILEKIKKLLALAESSNPNEAALALSRAQKLMEEHSVSLADINLSDCQTCSYAMDAKKPNRYEAILINLVARSFGVKPIVGYTVNNHKVVAEVNYLGISPQPELAQYCFQVLYRQLKKARADYVKQQSNRCKPATKTKRGDSFAEGWVYTVASKVQTFALSDEQKALIETYVNTNHKDLQTGQGRARVKYSSQRGKDVIAGMEAAKNTRLDKPMNGSETAKLGATI